MVLKTSILLAATKRVPLIKFRKGGITSTLGSSASSGGGSGITGQASRMQGVVGEAIEDWQLPARYKRKPIDITEMEYINRGGPA